MSLQFSEASSYYVVTDTKISGFVGDYRWLSNFYGCPVAFNGCLYTSVEAAYQAAKSDDPEVHKKFQGYTAREAKDAGQKLTLRPGWESMKRGVMLTLLLNKFKQPDLAEKLLATGERTIEETNHWGDTYWGVDATTGQGQNWLGKLLGVVRKSLQLYGVSNTSTGVSVSGHTSASNH